MCGIVGFIDKKNRLSFQEKKNLIVKMRQLINYRGGDSVGEYIYQNLALGHTRLSIIDLSEKAKQPFFAQGKNYALSYNGEIYNHLALRGPLKNKCAFKTVSDTETLLQAYLAWGLNCLTRLKGMFAFALLDKKKNQLHLAIDRFGIKSLYFINNDNWFAFASEIKALFLLPDAKAKLNEEVLIEYLLYRHPSGSQTMFKDVWKLIPAQCLTVNLRNYDIKTRSYWKLRKTALPQNLNLQKELLTKIDQAVAEHLLAHAPLGLQLSGGVDSSLIAALAAPKKRGRFHSFSIGLKQKDWNEFKFSRLVAKKLNTRHHEITFTENDFCRLLPPLTFHMDEPIGHPHSVPMYILANYARKTVKVLLSGEGADEVFGGYRRYEKLLSGKKTNNKFIVQMGQFGDEKILQKITNLDFSDAWQNRLSILKQHSRENYTAFDKASLIDIKTYLTPLLVRQDKMGMAANIENRVPFLDHQLVEFAFSLPEDTKLQRNKNPYWQTKPLLKKISAELLSPGITYRQKIGFGLPISQWLRNKKGLGRYLNFFNNPGLRARPYLDYQPLQGIVKEHQAGKKDYGETLWILLNLELWTRIFLEGEKSETILLSL